MPTTIQAMQRRATASEPTIVAIGASAGGVSALQSFFSALPEHPGAAFVVVVHLDPQHRSELPSILATKTRMPVVQVTARERVQADHVYVISPDRRLQLVDHEISAFAFDQPRGQRAPIDLFFRSLADQLGEGFAVILSGAGSDGALGARAVKESGGIILVQDPNEAEYALDAAQRHRHRRRRFCHAGARSGETAVRSHSRQSEPAGCRNRQFR